jgi:hypothetical protein
LAKEKTEADIRDLMIDAAEVQLAATKAGIAFWSSWLGEAGRFSQATEACVRSLRANESDAQAALDLATAGQAYLRAMMGLPEQAARVFSDELASFANRRGATGARSRRRSAKAKP